MVTPTSSFNRSKRKSTKPVTSDKGRKARGKVSTAQTTSSDTRAKNASARVTNSSQRTSGSAKVTGTSKAALPAKSSASDLQRLKTASKAKPTRPAPRSMPKPQGKPALPPGQRGGALVSTGTRRTRAEAKASNAAKGSTGPNRVGRSDARPALPQGRQGGQLAKAPKGGAMTRVAGAAGKAASTTAGLGSRMLGAAGTALMIPSAIKNIADVAERNRQWDAYKERMGMNKPQQSQGGTSSSSRRRTGQNNKTANVSVPTSPRGSRGGAAAGTRTRSTNAAKPSSALQGRVGNANVTDLRRSQEDARKAQLERANRGKGSSTQSGSDSTQSRSSSSSGSGSSRPMPRPQSGPASNAGMKNQNKDFRGNPNRKDSIASTLSELRSMGSGRKVEGVGPVASGSDYAKSKNETLKERMERMKKRRQGTSIGGVD